MVGGTPRNLGIKQAEIRRAAPQNVGDMPTAKA